MTLETRLDNVIADLRAMSASHYAIADATAIGTIPLLTASKERATAAAYSRAANLLERELIRAANEEFESLDVEPWVNA